MVEAHRTNKPSYDSKYLLKETSAIFTLQLVLIVAIVQFDRIIGLGGNLHMLVAVIFVLLPVYILDRTGKPYARYGIAWGNPKKDFFWALGAMVLFFPPIALCAPTLWGIDPPPWQFLWPEGYPGVAFAHFVVVALPEEFFYRGYLMGRIDDILPPRLRFLGARVGWSLPIQALLFALGHFLIDYNPGRLAVFFPALAFGWLKSKTAGLFAPVIFHAFSNIFMEIFRTGLGL